MWHRKTSKGLSEPQWQCLRQGRSPLVAEKGLRSRRLSTYLDWGIQRGIQGHVLALQGQAGKLEGGDHMPCLGKARAEPGQGWIPSRFGWQRKGCESIIHFAKCQQWHYDAWLDACPWWRHRCSGSWEIFKELLPLYPGAHVDERVAQLWEHISKFFMRSSIGHRTRGWRS